MNDLKWWQWFNRKHTVSLLVVDGKLSSFTLNRGWQWHVREVVFDTSFAVRDAKGAALVLDNSGYPGWHRFPLFLAGQRFTVDLALDGDGPQSHIELHLSGSLPPLPDVYVKLTGEMVQPKPWVPRFLIRLLGGPACRV